MRRAISSATTDNRYKYKLKVDKNEQIIMTALLRHVCQKDYTITMRDA